MELTCQRCHEILRDTDRYCPVCGLPQLIYVAAEMPTAPTADAADQPGGLAAGAQAGIPGAINWRIALQAAGMLAVPAGVLCSRLNPLGQALGIFWIVSAAAWAVGLYARRAQPGPLSLGMGARIGLVTGLLASWLMVAVDGVSVWGARFLLHQGDRIDGDWLTQVNMVVGVDQQLFGQMGISASEARGMLLSAEGRAGYYLANLLFGACFLAVIAAAGGAMRARLLASPRRPGA